MNMNAEFFDFDSGNPSRQTEIHERIRALTAYKRAKRKEKDMGLFAAGVLLLILIDYLLADALRLAGHGDLYATVTPVLIITSLVLYTILEHRRDFSQADDIQELMPTTLTDWESTEALSPYLENLLKMGRPMTVAEEKHFYP